MAPATPKISIVSPSFNCAGLVQRCIESVLAQNYPNFEHIIVDGASTDGTVEVLKRYPHLRWISEPDKGEAEALNKALRMVTGDVVNWLNVDDAYLGNQVFHLIAQTMEQQPGYGVYYGRGLSVNEDGEVQWCRRPLIPLDLPALMRWFNSANLFQPAMFYRRDVIEDTGFFREDLHYGIDYDYWLRVAARGHKSFFIERVLALATLVRKGAKSQGSYEEQHLAWMEIAAPFQRYLSYAERVNFWHDFYSYRINCQVPYEHELVMPEGDAELQGFTIAALEKNHMPLAVQAVERLGALYPKLPDTYWLLSEILSKGGNAPLSVQSMQQGAALTASEPGNS